MLLLFYYYFQSKIHLLFKLGDQFLTMGLHYAFDVIQIVSNKFGPPDSYQTYHQRVRPSKISGGVGRFRWKLRASRHGKFHRKHCSSGRHGRNKSHPFCKRPSATRRQPTHFREARRAWKVQHPLDPNGWKWWKTKHVLGHTQQIASKSPKPIPLRVVSRENPLSRYIYPNLSTDFIVAIPGFPGRIDNGYPTHCVFGHVLDGSDPLEMVDSSKEISNPTYADICNPLMKPRSGRSVSKPTVSNKKLNQRKGAKVNFDKDTKRVPKSRSASSKSRKARSAVPKSRSGSLQQVRSVAGHHKNRLYIDSGASLHILFNRELLEDIRDLDRPKDIAAGGKNIKLSQIGSLHTALRHLPLPKDDYHYDDAAIANLLSFARLADDYYILCNTRVDDAIYVQSKEDGKFLRFQRCPRYNLYYMDIGEGNPDGHCYFNSVANNQKDFSILDQKRAEACRMLQEKCGFPSDTDFINALEHGEIPNVDFGRRDVKIANKIYGYSAGAAMGKMKHPRKGHKMERVSEDTISPVPSSVLENYKNIHLDIDLFFVNEVAFFLATSRDIGFIHCKAVLSKEDKRVANALRAVVNDYEQRGFKVISASGDMAFEPMRQWITDELNITLTTCDADAHVPRAENAIKFVKERVRCIQSELGFTKYPRRLTIEMITRTVSLINSFARRTLAHKTMSPRRIMYGRGFKTPLCKFGELVMAYEPNSSNNTNVPRCFYALYLYPNENGSGHVVFSLKLKTRRSTQKCVLQPMTQDIIDLVNNLGTEEKVQDGIQFYNVDGGATITDLYAADENDDDSCASDKDYKSNDDDVNASDDNLDANEEWDDDDDSSESDDDDHPSDNEYDLDDGIESDESSINDQNENDHGDVAENEHQNDHFANPENESEDEESVNAGEQHDQDVERLNLIEADDDEEEAETIAEVPRQEIQRQERSQRRRSRRNNASSNPGKSGMVNRLDSNLGDYWKDPTFTVSCHTIDHTDGTSFAMMVAEQAGIKMMQEYFELEASKSTPMYGLRKGLQIFGDSGYESTVKELRDNLIGRGCIDVLTEKETNWDMRKEALSYLMFLKRKRCGKLKARGCADGRPQREYITKEESSSPTVSLYALMGSCVMDAMDERAVITVDIPGAFLQGDWPQDEHPAYIKFEGLMVDMICDIDPSCIDKVQWNKQHTRKFLYARLVKAVYGTVLAAIIFYNKLSKHLTDHGFVMNDYDMCTFNKMVDGEQLTVQFHVDDLKASHKDQKVLDDFLDNLRSEFGQEDELAETRGRVHEYLGITIDYSLPGKVVFTMFDFLEDVIVEAPDDLKKSRSYYPGNDKLFHVDDESPKLSQERAELFHRIVARLLFASKRARPDIQVCVAFLCTRVKSPNEQDYEKLGRVITYLMKTIHLPLIIGADESGSMVWNIDASFAVHADCKSHTGASLTLGHGSVLSMSCKQKINTKSSTEAELVGVDDAMTFVMWMKHFFECQVKQINEHSKLKRLGSDTIIEQDNTSAIQLEKNGWKSSSKRTKHIDVRYFYVTDRLKKKDISRIVYKPTADMESDYFTKALQGTPFHTHRKTLMGLDGTNDHVFYDKFKHPKINDDKLYTPQPSSE